MEARVQTTAPIGRPGFAFTLRRTMQLNWAEWKWNALSVPKELPPGKSSQCEARRKGHNESATPLTTYCYGDSEESELEKCRKCSTSHQKLLQTFKPKIRSPFGANGELHIPISSWPVLRHPPRKLSCPPVAKLCSTEPGLDFWTYCSLQITCSYGTSWRFHSYTITNVYVIFLTL